MSERRKFAAIAVLRDSGGDALYAVANDGSAWWVYLRDEEEVANQSWRRVPDLPNDEEAQP